MSIQKKTPEYVQAVDDLLTAKVRYDGALRGTCSTADALTNMRIKITSQSSEVNFVSKCGKAYKFKPNSWEENIAKIIFLGQNVVHKVNCLIGSDWMLSYEVNYVLEKRWDYSCEIKDINKLRNMLEKITKLFYTYGTSVGNPTSTNELVHSLMQIYYGDAYVKKSLQ